MYGACVLISGVCGGVDAHRLHPLAAGNRVVETREDRGDVLPSPASAGAPDEASRARAVRSVETAGRGGGDGEFALVYGYAWGGEAGRSHYAELYAWGYAEAGEDPGGVFEFVGEEVVGCVEDGGVL